MYILHVHVRTVTSRMSWSIPVLLCESLVHNSVQATMTSFTTVIQCPRSTAVVYSQAHICFTSPTNNTDVTTVLVDLITRLQITCLSSPSLRHARSASSTEPSPVCITCKHTRRDRTSCMIAYTLAPSAQTIFCSDHVHRIMKYRAILRCIQSCKCIMRMRCRYILAVPVQENSAQWRHSRHHVISSRLRVWLYTASVRISFPGPAWVNTKAIVSKNSQTKHRHQPNTHCTTIRRKMKIEAYQFF